VGVEFQSRRRDAHRRNVRAGDEAARALLQRAENRDSAHPDFAALPRVIRVLGVDDWAWCKGQTFGTILVDLERSQVVDLLPTRSADSFGEWLAQHPEVTKVSRDRQGVYAEAPVAAHPKQSK
jgi:transposase